MPGLGLGLGLQYGGVVFAYDSQAQAHFNRVIADGGVIPAGLAGCDAWFKAVKAAYGVSDITAAIASGLDPHYLGYKLGAGSGVSLGSAAQTCYNAIGSIGDVVQGSASSQPLILPHTGTNYVWLPGVDGNGFTTPHSTANNITENWEVIVQTKFSNSTALGCLLSKRAFGNSQYAIFKLSSGSIYITQSVGGVQFDGVYASNIGTSFNGFIKITRNAITGTILIYTSLDGISYTLQSTNAGPIGTLDVINTPIKIGAEATTLISPYQGEIYKLTISNSIGGTPVVDFNPASYNAQTSQTQWTSSTGEVWTINTGTAATGYKGVLIDRTIIQGDGVDDLIKNTPFATSANCTDYIAFKQFGWVNSDFIFDGAVVDSIGLQQITISPNIRFEGAGGGGGVSNFVANTLSMATILGSSTLGSVNLFRNNTSLSVGGTKADSQGYTLFAKANSTSFSNASINTMIKALGQDDATRRLAIYNFIRSLNNNAF